MIDVQVEGMLKTLSRELSIPEDDLLKRGLRAFLEQQLRLINAEVLEICGRYHVSGVEEMEARYREGTLDEADSWRDLQRLDHLEYKRDRLQRLLETLA